MKRLNLMVLTAVLIPAITLPHIADLNALPSREGSVSRDSIYKAWEAIYNGPGDDHYASALAVDANGNVYVTGRSSNDYATVKYNPDGVEQWVARYNGPGFNNDYAEAIAVDDGSNVYVTGGSRGEGNSVDYATIKYDENGVEQWVARYNGEGNSHDNAEDLAVDDSGNVYVTGISIESGGNYDYTTIKYNTSGAQQWIVHYNGPGNDDDEASALAIDDSGNVYVTGYSFGSNDDYATVKYSADGVEQWVARYNDPGDLYDYAYDIAVDHNGNVYITGKSNVPGNYYDYTTIKYNASGVEQWVANYDGTGNHEDEATALALDAGGNVYVTGKSRGVGAEYLDYATVKYNTDGVEQWVARYNGQTGGVVGFDVAWAIALDANANVYVTGQSRDSGTDYDYATVKYDSSGAEQWVARYNRQGNFGEFAYAIAIDNRDNVYVTGHSNSGSASVYATVKYSQTAVGVDEEKPEIPAVYHLEQNYPNPFNPTTNIEFSIPKSDFVTLKIYNILGQEVSTLVSEKLAAGKYKYDWPARSSGGDASRLASGVYLYRLEVGDNVKTMKMILLR